MERSWRLPELAKRDCQNTPQRTNNHRINQLCLLWVLIDMENRENRNRIISLLRGQAACQTIAALAETGVAESMLSGESFAVEDFTAVSNPQILHSSFKYLHSLDLLSALGHSGRYALTPAGRTVFKRAGAFLLLSSYNPYFVNLGNLLMGEEIGPEVDRRRNVLGSGSLHSRKFFPCVWEELAGHPPQVLIDLGCGDGTFLELACREWPAVIVVASDMSPLAVEYSVARLKQIGRPAGAGIVADASAVESWVSELPEALKSASPCVVSIWFVAHEFSNGKPETILDFFHRLRSSLPGAQIVLAEIVAIPADVLAANYSASIMPEFLFFHELSKQGVLGWDTWQAILRQIPYALSAERQFDLVDGGDGAPVPSSFVWHLRPA
jgi:SAM-dependent methyltransferase